MSSNLSRTAALLASAGVVAAGMTAFAGAAEAAPAGDLRVTVDSKCVISHDRPATDRIVHVRNVGGSTVRNIRIGELGGPEVGIPRLAEDQEIHPRTVGGNRWYSATGVRTANQLRPGESVKYWHVVPGCNGPWVIAGYAMSNPSDNVFNAPNGDLRWSAEKPRQERPRPRPAA